MDFSIIIPTYNRSEPLKNCLSAIQQLDYSKHKFEVIVVDDGSDRPVNEVLNGFFSDINLHLLWQENSGPATARNYGAEEAKGKYLVYIDDDCLVEKDHLKTATTILDKSPQAVLVGKTINFYEENCCSTASQVLTDYLHFFFKGTDGMTSFLVSNNFIVNKSVFQKIGGLDGRFSFPGSEDRELGERLAHYGYEVLYKPDLMVRHAHEMNFSQFVRQHFNYGRSSVVFRDIARKYNSSKRRIDPFGFYFNMLLFPFKKKYQCPSFYLSLLLMVSQLTYIGGHVFEKYFNRENADN